MVEWEDGNTGGRRRLSALLLPGSTCLRYRYSASASTRESMSSITCEYAALPVEP